MKRLTKNQYEKCVAHYTRMITWAEKQSKRKRYQNCFDMEDEMDEAINESCCGYHCCLCRRYGEGYCQNCPLYINGYGCNESISPWKSMRYSLTWPKLIKGARKMLEIFEELKPL